MRTQKITGNIITEYVLPIYLVAITAVIAAGRVIPEMAGWMAAAAGNGEVVGSTLIIHAYGDQAKRLDVGTGTIQVNAGGNISAAEY